MVLHWRGFGIKHFIELQCNLIAGNGNYHEVTLSIGQFSDRKSTRSSITVLFITSSLRRAVLYIRTSVYLSYNSSVGVVTRAWVGQLEGFLTPAKDDYFYLSLLQRDCETDLSAASDCQI